MSRERIAQLPDDDWRKTRSADFQEPRLSKNLALVEVMADIARHAVGAAAIAMAWVLRNPAVSGTIVAARRPSQVACQHTTQETAQPPARGLPHAAPEWRTDAPAPAA